MRHPVTRTAVVALVAAAVMCSLVLNNISNEMVERLAPCFGHIWAVGPLGAASQPLGNCTLPNLSPLTAPSPADALAHPVILSTLLSIIGNALLAAALWRLLLALGTPRAGRKALVVMALPSLALNAGLLAQGDAIWAAAYVMALTAAIQHRHATMLAWFGLAVAINFQPAFCAPLVLAVLIGRRVPLRLWPIAPLTFLAAMLPALLEGGAPSDMMTFYIRQADSPAAMSSAPNIWTILQSSPLISNLPLTGLALAAAFGTSAWLIALFVQRQPDRERLVAAALLMTLVIVGLLPRMHEGCLFLADVLSLALALSKGNPRSWAVAALVQVGSTLALAGFLSGLALLPILGAGAMIAATVVLARPFLTSPANDNGLPLNPLAMHLG